MTKRSPYQMLTREEILALTTLPERIQRWRVVRDIIREFYGERARFVVISAATEREGVPLHFEVQDAQGQRCPVDRDLPWYQEWTHNHPSDPLLSDEDLRVLETNVSTAIQFDEDLPEIPATYDLLNPPTTDDREPVLYVRSADPLEPPYAPVDLETAAQWSQAYLESERWRLVHDSIRAFYGPRACSVGILTETGKDGRETIEEILVWDAEGELLLLEEEPPIDAAFPAIDATYDLLVPPLTQSLPEMYRLSDAPFLPREVC